MDSRGGRGRMVNRQPLGDTTKQVNNTTPNIDYHYPVNGNENTTLSRPKNPAHATSTNGLATKSTGVSQLGSRAPAMPMAPEAAALNPRLSAIAQDSCEPESRRASQFSQASSNSSNPRHTKTHIGPWQLGRTLGKGSQARVRLGRHRVSSQLVAIKIVPKGMTHITQAGSLANLDRIDRQKFTSKADDGLRRMPLAIEREVAILKLIQHPNIIKLLDIWESRAEIYLITEYVEKGDLFEFINYNRGFNEMESMFYFRQIMSALEYCHSFNICHRDLKPENILISSRGQIKIADFGMAALQQGPAHRLRTACGSPHYAAPELLSHQEYEGSAVDIWSMGVIFFAMISGRLPFDGELQVMLGKAKKAQYEMPKGISREAQDLIRRILVVNPSQRITMEQMWRQVLVKKYEYVEQWYEWEGPPRDALQSADLGPIPETEVDIQILRQLKSLWHSYDEKLLMRKLCEDKENDFKMFYWLLYKHRERQLENYNNDVPISKSDFHHLKPPNWGKRISTCKFTQAGPNGYGRSVSKFTVISNVTEPEDDEGTVKSYDPYKSTEVLQPRSSSDVSHAKIVVHRNHLENVSHSYHSYMSVNGEFRQHPTLSPEGTSTPGQLKSPRGSTGSIRSLQSTPRKVRVVKSRTKRGVDFSNVRNKEHHTPRGRDTSSDRGSDDYRTGSPSRRQKPKAQGNSHRQQVVQKSEDDNHIWKEELQELGLHAASYCDQVFGTSLPVLPGTKIGSSEFCRVDPHDLSSSLGAFSTSQFPKAQAYVGMSRNERHPLESMVNRPLPPIPTGRPRIPRSPRIENSFEPCYQKNKHLLTRSNLPLSVADRRVVSEPVHGHGGREARPLPSIYENASEDMSRESLAKSSGLGNSAAVRTPADNTGFDYLASVENTIRVVSSPVGTRLLHPADIPAPLNVRKVSRDTSRTPEAAPAASSNGASRPASGGTDSKGYTFDSHRPGSNVGEKNRVTSWFKRHPKDNASDSSFATVTEDGARDDDANPDAVEGKKKAFSFPFWRSNAKETPRMSVADSDEDIFESEHHDEAQQPKPGKNRPKTSANNTATQWPENEASGTRQIEAKQNWLSRLFRWKPANRYLCFSVPKRDARHRLVAILRGWKKYGIKDIEVDKKRSVIFGRVGRNRHGLKEVSFAVELMTVIEHGKRNPLTIARFTQEKGAASSFNRLVDELSYQFAIRSLLVADKSKVSMMIKTLNS